MRYSRLVLVGALIALLGSACGGDGGGGGDGTTSDTVTMVDNAFEPSELTVSSGTTLTLVNEGAAAHTFTVADQGIDEQVSPGTEGSVEISLDAGTYDFTCSFHPEMTGTLTVQ